MVLMLKAMKIRKFGLNADYETIYKIVEDILEKSGRDIPNEAKILLESYNDLLIKEGIVANSTLQELCEKIWKHNKTALDVLTAHRPDNIRPISDIILRCLIHQFGIEEEEVKKRQNKGHIFRFTTTRTRKLKYKFEFYLEFSKDGIYLGINKINPEVLDTFKTKNKQSKRFYERSKWENYIEESYEENKISEHMNPVIEEIKKWEDTLEKIEGENL